jgi:hypothetical protein
MDSFATPTPMGTSTSKKRSDSIGRGARLSMPILSCKKRRNRLNGRFSYVVRNAMKHRPARKDYVLKIPDQIRRAAGWQVGMRIELLFDSGTLILQRFDAKRRAIYL